MIAEGPTKRVQGILVRRSSATPLIFEELPESALVQLSVL